MHTKRLILLAALISLVALWGCSSSMDSASGTDTNGNTLQDQIDAAGFVGAAKCIDCHSGFSWSAEAVQAYLEGKHVIHSLSINADSDAACLECHDPIGDGPLIEGLINSLDVPAEGLAAVTCEVCHGSGIDHYGIGPIPDPTPDYTVCGECHDSTIPHISNPETIGIAEDYVASKHAESGDRNDPRCVKCHTDEGGRKYKNVHTAAQLYAVALPLAGDISPIQCRTCHDSHNAGELQLGESEIELEFSGDDFDASAEYATCTNCHQPHNAAIYTDPLILADLDDTDGPNGDLIYHGKRYNRVIANTHYDDPATTDVIEGYTMDPENERVCRDCHNVHESRTAINVDWAESGHGGFLHLVKDDAAASSGDPIRRTYQDIYNVRTAGAHGGDPADLGFAAAWVYYDWDATTKYDAPDIVLDRGDCQRCHTATGAKNYMTNPATYDPLNNNFSHLEDWSLDGGPDGETVSSGQNEMLYCWGCHTDNAGGLRNPGAITEEYDAAVTVEYPDVNGSNICMTCHLGRETGEVVKQKTGFDDERFVNSHYLAAGGTVFGTTGYTFGTRDYSIPAGDTHAFLGLGLTGNAVVDADYTNGPCVTCHFGSGDGSHTLSPFTEYPGGTLDDVALNPVCVNCHTSRGDDSDAADL
ncbi:MAG: multiheme c-type cytochrome, partial [Desulfobulbaceae bacterium]|nr:multiheme c-type cytochrome [Desulfobulbaceae bacterium]